VVTRRPGYSLVAVWRRADAHRRRIRMRAPVGRVLEAEKRRAVARAPRHYRWVRMLERRATAAWSRWRRGARSAHSGIPPWWCPRCGGTADRRGAITVHVRVITTGMDVYGNIQGRQEGDRLTIVHEWDGPKWPLIGRAAADVVIGPVFIPRHRVAHSWRASVGSRAQHA